MWCLLDAFKNIEKIKMSIIFVFNKLIFLDLLNILNDSFEMIEIEKKIFFQNFIFLVIF